MANPQEVEGEYYDYDRNNMPIDSQREWTMRYLTPFSERTNLDFSCANITPLQAEEIIARMKVIELARLGGFEITEKMHQAKIDGILNTSRGVEGFNSVIATQQITKQQITQDSTTKEVREREKSKLIFGGSSSNYWRKRR